MNKEVKRYAVAPINLHEGPLVGMERHVYLSEDYDALLAERDALKAELADLVRVVGMSVDGSSARNNAMEKAFTVLQGAQP